MKKIIILGCILTGLQLMAQSPDKNYIVTTVPYQVVTNPTTLTDNNSNTTIQYFDGLGRPIQTVQRGITPAKQDLATYTEYDGAGREWKQYLPIPSAGNGAFVDYSAFTSGAAIYAAEGRPYAESLLEASPLNRVLGAKKPGNAWASHPSTIAYDGNSTTIPNFYVDNSTQKLKKGTPYATFTLYKTTVADEDGKSSIEYKDKLGQVILKCNASNVFTYYVYNDLGQLAYVLPPIAYDNLTANIGEGSYIEDTNTELLKYAYLYKYDESGNCIAKRLPGCDWIYMVYDQADRLILSQDGNQRPTNQWTVTKYDVFGRVLYTGITTETTSHSNLIADLNDEVITESWTTSNSFNNIGYTCGRFAPTKLLTVNYYDTYDFVALTNSQLAYDNSRESECGVRYSSAKSLLTGSRTYLLDNSGNYTAAAIYYDYRGRVIQTRATNHRAGYEISYSALNFSGNPVKVYKTHSINGTTPSVTELYTYTYDHAQRLKTTSHSLNDAPTSVVIASNSYDELGRLAGKACHNAAESTSYTYNIQNWLKTITNSSWKEEVFYQDAPENPMYNGNIAQSTWTYNRRPHRGYKYTYDDLNRLTQADYGEQSGLSAKQHLQDEYFSYDKMGNIKTIQRKSVGRLIDNLSFEYNGNQLKRVDEAGENGAWYDETAYTNFSITALTDFSYDANGNMTSDLDKNIVAIKYNVLNLPDTIQFKNGNQMVNLYTAGGQKLRTKYYTLYSPVLMPVGATRTGYTTGNSSMRLDDYMGNILYEAGSSETYHPLTKILTSEGYIDYAGGRQYCYFKKDHLGSIREVGKYYGADRVVVQKTQYYPSGTPYWEGFKSGEQPFKFTGKEMITMHGLNWQDYGARWLDNVRMQWTSVDPLAELMPGISPYAYCFNNPMKYIDPTGMIGEDSSKDMWGRDKFNSFTGVYIPPMDRPGGMTAQGYGNSNYGYFKETLTGYSANSWSVTAGGITTYHYDNMAPIYETEWIWYSQEERMSGSAAGHIENAMKWVVDPVGNMAAFLAGRKYTPSNPFRTGYWKAKNGQYLSLSLTQKGTPGWNFYAKSANLAANSVKYIGPAAQWLGYVSSAYSVYKFIDSPSIMNGINLGVNATSLAFWEVGVLYYGGSKLYELQQSAFKTLIDNGHGDNPNLYNVTW